MDIKTASIVLGILGIISLYFTVRVLIYQIPLLKTHDNPLDRRLRFLFFFIALTLFLGNLVFLAIDAGTIFYTLTRSTRQLNLIGVIYTFSMSIAYAISTGLLWLFYKIIDKDNKLRKLAEKQ